MARIRSVKPEFWSSLTIAKLSTDARLTFIGLWNYADDYGRAIDDVRLIKAAIWPLDDRATTRRIAVWLSEIAALGLIYRYDASGVSYLQVTTWDEHQRVDHPKASVFPPPPSREPLEASREPLEASPPSCARAEGRGLDGIGKEVEQGGEGNAGATLAPVPVGLSSHPAVVLYWRRFKLARLPAIGLQERIESDVGTDIEGWTVVLDFWRDNGYRAESVGKMLEKYHENKQSRGKVSNGAQRQTASERNAEARFRSEDLLNRRRPGS